MCVLQVLVYFTQINVLQVNPCCCQWQDSLPFLRLNNIPLHVYITSSPVHPSMDTGFFHPLDVVNNFVTNIGEQISLQDPEFN